MRLVTFQKQNKACLGAMVADGILDIEGASQSAGVKVPTAMQALIDAGPAAWDAVRELIEKCPAENVVAGASLLAPLPKPVRIRDCSLFLEHMELAMEKLGKTMHPEFKRQVIYYNADNVHIYGPDDDVPWPRASKWIDYELEWACVVGRAGANISVENARDHIFGYTVFNDWSARDLQFPFMDAGLGPAAGKDFANSLGPCIVTPDEFEDPYKLKMQARINGEVWSDGATDSMFHSFEDAVSQLSADRPLIPGEIMGSGTVLRGCGFELDRKLAIGDEIELEIEGIGILRNRVVASS